MTGSDQQRQPILRPTARALMLDPSHRILLIAAIDPLRLDMATLWVTPGGALEGGESHEDAIVREMREETGFTARTLGPCVWTRDHTWTWNGAWYRSIERYCPVHVPAGFSVTSGGMGAMELQATRGTQWWTVEPIEQSGDTFAPRRLASLVREYIRSGSPSAPIDAGD